MNMDLDTVAKLARPYYTDHNLDVSDIKKYLLVVDNARHRVNTFSEMPEESYMFYNDLDISTDSLDLVSGNTAQKLLKAIHASLIRQTDCNGDQFKDIVMMVGNSLGVKGKDLFFPIRTALYGDPMGPDIPHVYSILGRDETLNRLSMVIK